MSELSERERETLARIESTPAAPESFDATAAVRRVMALAKKYERISDEPMHPQAADAFDDAAFEIRRAVNGQPS